MRCIFPVFVCAIALAAGVTAQSPATATPPVDRLPVARVVLYKTGVGYFEHLGTVRDSQDVDIRFTSGQLNDVVKSLTALDLNGGRITGISYNSAAPLDRQIDALRIPLSHDTSLVQVLMALRGTRVEATTPAGSATGRLLTVERHPRREDGTVVEEDTFSLLTDAGDVRTFELGPLTRVRLAEADMRQELAQYLNLVGSTREQDVRRLMIGTDGRGERRLFVSYISEVPIWKTTYRLVLPGQESAGAPRQPFLQGWAVVDNTIGEDWTDVELSLVAGAPQSFIQQISQPYYSRRPVVPLPSTVLMSPQTHAPTQQTGVVGGIREEVASPPPPPPAPAARDGVAGGVSGGVYRGGNAAKARTDTAAYMREQQAAAAAADLGDLFEYRVKTPVTILKNQSALVPIVNADITADKVSLWTPAQPARPMRAVWITNTTGLTLDGGSVAVMESNAFAGEGLVEPLKPSERRLISYAADLGVRVLAADREQSSRTVRVRSQEGFLLVDRQERREQTYQIRNEDGSARAVIIEHPIESGWKLVEGPRPEETSADAHRFRVAVNARAEAALTVRETLAGETRLSITEITDDEIIAIAGTGVSADALRRELEPVLAKRRELSLLEGRLFALGRELTRITEDQARVRENMKALRGSAEERLLLQRYTRQLDADETRLDAIRQDSAKLSADIEGIRGELTRLAAAMAFELTAAR